MRGAAIIAAWLVLISGTIGYCPACDVAMEQQAPPDAHACCAKTPVAPESEMPSPAGDSSNAPSDESSDCGRFHSVRMLSGVEWDLASLSDNAAVIVDVVPAEVELPVVVAAGPEPLAVDTSPPLTPSVPLRI